jgi:OOP family OmpA-OmpF porin
MHGIFKWSSKWWPGTIPLAILWAVAAWSNTTPLETDLAARSTAALNDAVLDKKQIVVEGRDVKVCRGRLGRRSRRSGFRCVPGVVGQ